ncbi:MAG: hypothetical protein RL338_1034 [Chloroflexota bacterium]
MSEQRGRAALPFDGRTALVVTDLQNDFADPAGSLHVAGGEGLVSIVDRLVGCARDAGALVVYTQDWHPEETPHFAAFGGAWPPHCVKGTWGAELVAGLDVAGPVIRKGANGEDGYSGFTMRDPTSGATVPTGLEALLRGRGVERILVCGLATDYCVGATAEDAVALGFRTTLLVDAIRAVDLSPGDGERTIARLEAAGVVLAEAARLLAAVAGTAPDAAARAGAVR